jgi:REP element-mobilizing transposase RayT
VQGRESLFGEVAGGEMWLNKAGEEVEKWWRELPNKFPLLDLDEHITMPNHFHGIVTIVDPQAQPYNSPRRKMSWRRDSSSLGEIMQWFKTMITNAYIGGVKAFGWPRFQGRLWQRNYYEHIIRTGAALRNIRNYIRANPVMWAFDQDNLQAVTANKEALRKVLSLRFGLTPEEIEFVIDFDPYQLEEFLYPDL